MVRSVAREGVGAACVDDRWEVVPTYQECWACRETRPNDSARRPPCTVIWGGKHGWEDKVFPLPKDKSASRGKVRRYTTTEVGGPRPPKPPQPPRGGPPAVNNNRDS